MSVIPTPLDFKGDPSRFTDALMTWFHTAGNDVTTGGDKTLLDHAATSAHLAQKDNAPKTEIVSAYFHMVGALLMRHDPADPITLNLPQQVQLGATWLEKFFPRTVTEPVRLYPLGRRWLLALDKNYRALLTDREYRELADLGGPLVSKERERFENLPNWQAAVSLARRHDVATVQKPCAQTRQTTPAGTVTPGSTVPFVKNGIVQQAIQNCLTVPHSVLVDNNMSVSTATKGRPNGAPHSVSATI